MTVNRSKSTIKFKYDCNFLGKWKYVIAQYSLRHIEFRKYTH